MELKILVTMTVGTEEVETLFAEVEKAGQKPEVMNHSCWSQIQNQHYLCHRECSWLLWICSLAGFEFDGHQVRVWLVQVLN